MAMAPDNGQRGQRETTRLGLPDGFKVYSPFPFGGVDQQAARTAIANQDFAWRENLVKVGNGYLRAVGDAGTPVYTAPAGTTIVSFFFFSRSQKANLVAIFLNTGVGIELDLDTQTETTMGVAFYNGNSLPACVQWGSQYLLIANNFTSSCYFVWDGSVHYEAGTLGPIVTVTDGGSGYTSVPFVMAYGGSGSGATFTADIANGSVTQVTVTNAGTGYASTDAVQLLFQGGGSDTGVELLAVLGTGATVGNVIVTAGGAGYTPGTYALGFAGGGGSGAAGSYTVAVDSVISATVTANGGGYTSTPTVSFPSGGGAGAAGTALLLDGGFVSSIVIANAGTNVEGTPVVSFLGGGGTGATAVLTVAGGVVTGSTITNGGSGYSTVPAVAVSGGNRAAQAVATLMPTGISGNVIETFQSRVWLAVPFQEGTVFNGGSLLVSAVDDFTDFATSDGGLIFTSSDPFLRVNYINLKQTNGYLYAMGDSSISIISNVQTSGTPVTTSFTYQNTDPQVGAGWRDSVQAYGRALVFANHDGIFGLYGGAVTKLSEKLNRLIDNAILPLDGDNQPVPGALVPSSAVCLLFETKLHLTLMTITDPFTGLQRRVMLAWDGKEYFVASQTPTLTYIATQEVSSNILAYGTNGTGLYRLFSEPSTALTKTLITKLYGAEDFFVTKASYAFYFQATDMVSPPAGITLTVTIDTEDNSYPLPVAPALDAPYPQAPVYGARSGDVYGQVLGCSIMSTSADFVVLQVGLGYFDAAALA